MSENDIRMYTCVNVCIILQEPTLFTGTIRFNLDPMGQASTAEIWKALERCHIAEKVCEYMRICVYEITSF